jgi:hypothetical protein
VSPDATFLPLRGDHFSLNVNKSPKTRRSSAAALEWNDVKV